MKFFATSAIVLFVLNSWAGLGEDFRDLRDSGANYEVVGVVCEEVTRLRFQEEFPAPKYGVTTGVEYGDGQRTIGELDVVVYEANTHQVVRVAEVKCWKDNNGAIAKAREQRSRFIRTLQSGRTVYFRSLSSQIQFRKDHFMRNQQYMAVAPKGSTAAGFERELSYELRELMQLRQMMLKCQSSQQCAPPQRH